MNILGSKAEKERIVGWDLFSFEMEKLERGRNMRKLLGVGADTYGYWQDVCDGFGGEVVSLFPIFSECNKRKGVNFFFGIIYFFMLFFVYYFPVF